ncbi:MAG: Isoniazid-induced protein IniC [Acidimicrobiales bacterium]|nr:MAG: GTP-binding protein [Actinomycetota bacterium]MBV6508433.1 Isoniazid-induced protein IniC [Acidimicrobiales bacterium]RIK04759.1 MAG: GTP-binding protein [Acidobacteriota bacterium]
MTVTSLLPQVRSVLDAGARIYSGTESAERIAATIDRLDEPLRVAIAGKVKAGKSTLLNALVGEELAPTDAGECTKIVTWYHDGITYRVNMYPKVGEPKQVPFARTDGAIDIDLGSIDADDVERLDVEWPSSSLRQVTLIDTPGIASLSTEVSERTHAFLAPGEDQITPADAVLYLMRHLHSTDVNFLEAFHDEEFNQPTPVNAIAVLSRADEVGVGRIDSMSSARRIANRYKSDPKVRRLAQTVVPVAGLLAQSGSTLREAEFKALSQMAAAPRDETEKLFLSADRFVQSPTSIHLTSMEREHLLDRLGMFGCRLSVALIRQGAAENASKLSNELVQRSGLNELREVLLSQFAERRDVLKARSALIGLENIVHEHPVPGSDQLAAEMERIHSGAHEFAEIRLLNSLRAGGVKLKNEEAEEMERLLGTEGSSARSRLGLPAGSSDADVRIALQNSISRWQRKAESPMSSRELVDASRVLIRSCEGLLVTLS